MVANLKLDRTLDEIVIWAGAPSINIYLGFLLGISSFIYYNYNLIKKQFRDKYKLIFLVVFKFLILCLYPLTILTLTEYKSYFIAKLLFGLNPEPIDGFGTAIVIVIIHLLVNTQLSKLELEVEKNMKSIWRVLCDLAILFVASTFLRGYLSLTFGILFAIILSFILTNEKLYNRNFILKNKKYLFI